jgi:hypothetical protein
MIQSRNSTREEIPSTSHLYNEISAYNSKSESLERLYFSPDLKKEILSQNMINDHKFHSCDLASLSKADAKINEVSDISSDSELDKKDSSPSLPPSFDSCEDESEELGDTLSERFLNYRDVSTTDIVSDSDVSDCSSHYDEDDYLIAAEGIANPKLSPSIYTRDLDVTFCNNTWINGSRDAICPSWFRLSPLSISSEPSSPQYSAPATLERTPSATPNSGFTLSSDGHYNETELSPSSGYFSTSSRSHSICFSSKSNLTSWTWVRSINMKKVLFIDHLPTSDFASSKYYRKVLESLLSLSKNDVDEKSNSLKSSKKRIKFLHLIHRQKLMQIAPHIRLHPTQHPAILILEDSVDKDSAITVLQEYLSEFYATGENETWVHDIADFYLTLPHLQTLIRPSEYPPNQLSYNICSLTPPLYFQHPTYHTSTYFDGRSLKKSS